jgi:hypothetical protein
VLDLNALKLCETRGFNGKFHTKSMYLGKNKYIYGRFGGHMNTISTSKLSRGLRMRFNVSTRVRTEVTKFFSGRRINEDTKLIVFHTTTIQHIILAFSTCKKKYQLRFFDLDIENSLGRGNLVKFESSMLQSERGSVRHQGGS